MYRLPRLRSCSVLVGLVCLLIVGPNLLQAQTFPYTVEDLGALPGETHVIPFGINAAGQVVGGSGFYRAFVFTDGVGMVELFVPGGRPSAIARSINDAGVVVGESWGGGMPFHAVRWTAGVGEDLGVFDESSRAWAINNAGIVVGDTPVDALDTGAFVFTDEGGTEMLVPSQYTSHAYDINDLGQATGAMTVGNAYHAFRYTPGAGIEDLGALPNFPFAFGKAINIGGQVAGTVTSASGNATRVFRYTDGIGMVELGGVGESNDVWGMNARGDFVGRGQPTAGLERAFLYTDEGGLQDLTSLIDPALGLRMFYAHDINDAGQIVGLAYESAVGRWLGVRLTPTAEPTGIGGGPTDVPGLRVHGIAPNPSNGFAQLEYELSQPSSVLVSIYDVTGRLVRTLVDAPQAAGRHPAVWDGRDRNGSDVPSGAYFVRIQAGAFRHNEKLMLVR